MREMLRKVTPQFARNRYHKLRRTDLYRRLRLTRDAKRLSRLADAAPDDDGNALCELLWRSREFRPLQIRSEAARLYERVRALRPSTVCEIGAAGGGTTFLFARASTPDALLVSLDLDFDQPRREAVSLMARGQQRIVCLRADSHAEETRRAVAEELRGRRLDLLFIDGDHSYAGVSRDFELYAPLVAPGGLVAFHDIVPLAAGDTNHDVGGVPKFWRELKSRHAGSVEEIIADESQSAFGIGLLRVE